MRTGPTVQITSITVLWLVLDGTGLALARNFTMTTTSSASTNSVIGTINQSVYCSNQRIWLMIGVADGCSPICHGAG